jgi:hypothetical protein
MGLAYPGHPRRNPGRSRRERSDGQAGGREYSYQWSDGEGRTGWLGEYRLNIYQPDGPVPPPEILGPVMARVNGFNAEPRSAGAWVFSVVATR